MPDIIKARIMSVMRNLPPLPQVTTQLLAVINDNDSSADDVTKVLSADGLLAGKVLKLVNSSFYGVTHEVTTVSRAVVLLGFTGIRNLALGFGTVDALKKLKC
ncbi:HD family phosphohydrolase, partial [bacterium DOLZORAL124_64_63]